jgi:4-diphosphocytidyl-2-C-methyl-D-erythritol kinase
MTRTVLAPAKINLGLEILGRRPDGFHEVRTILCAISLADRLTFERARNGSDEVVSQGRPVDMADRDNLILRALDVMREHGAAIPIQRVIVDKVIPAAAGLAGASSDAAATLRAFANELRRVDAGAERIAAALGSDVPFFLGGPVALAAGRGDVLTPLPQPSDAWLVLATPNLAIPDKTRTMYAAIDPAWWSNGSMVAGIARNMPALPTSAPFNVFERALMTLYPQVERVRTRMIDAGAPFVAVTGAGPTLYTLVSTRDSAEAIARRIGNDGVSVNVARLGAPEPTADG